MKMKNVALSTKNWGILIQLWIFIVFNSF